MTVPQETTDGGIAAAAGAIERYCDNHGIPMPSPSTALLMATLAQPPIAAAERERLYAELGNDHYVIFTEDRWTIEHSVECRLSGHMPECVYHTAIAEAAAEYDPEMEGRWRITAISSYGIPPLLERAGQPGEEEADA